MNDGMKVEVIRYGRHMYGALASVDCGEALVPKKCRHTSDNFPTNSPSYQSWRWQSESSSPQLATHHVRSYKKTRQLTPTRPGPLHCQTPASASMSRFFYGSDSSSGSSDEEELYSDEETPATAEQKAAAADDSSDSDSDSDEEDSDSDSSSDEEGGKTGANRFLREASEDSESDEEDKVTVVKSAKDKRYDELEGTIRLIENAEKINDWGVINDSTSTPLHTGIASLSSILADFTQTSTSSTASCLPSCATAMARLPRCTSRPSQIWRRLCWRLLRSKRSPPRR